MFNNLLNLVLTEGESAGNNTQNPDTQWLMYVILGVMVVLIVVWMIYSSKRRKKQEEEAKNLIDAVKPGNKVKTIGGICGIVVEVDNEENTFVLETGTEQSGKCFLKFDKQAIYQTDAVVEKAEKTEKPEEQPVAEAAAEETKELPLEQTAEEQPVQTEEAETVAEEPAAEEAKEEKPSKKSGKKH